MNKLGFFDTNIHVNISLINLNENFFKRYGNMNMADKVKDEISDWNRPDYDYKFIYDYMLDDISSTRITVIKYRDFTESQQLIIDRRIRDVRSSLDNRSSKKHDNKGEIYSAVYAELLSAAYFQTDDNFPEDLKTKEFQNLTFINMSQILNELCNENLKQKGEFERQIRDKRSKMDLSFKKEKAVEKNESSLTKNNVSILMDLKEELSKK